MSQITLSPNAAGAGIFTVAAPATGTNRTLTLPDQTGTLATTADPSTVLLGTIATTSGTSLPLSVTLTSYKRLFVVHDGVSFTTNTSILMNGFAISQNLGATTTDILSGTCDVDLATGLLVANTVRSTGAPSALGASVIITKTTISTATTTLTFTGGTFDAGQILVYGVK